MGPRLIVCTLFIVICFNAVSAFAGGPLLIGGPAVGSQSAFGHDGQPFTWDPAKMPIQYRVDPGPLATNPSGTVILDNASGMQRVQSMFGVWQGVATAAISFANAGPILAAGSYTGGDLSTVSQFNDVMGSCKSGTQNPIIFDANGKIMSGLGLPPEIIGFTSGCALDRTNGRLVSAAIVMNGAFQDGVNTRSSSPPNYELTVNEFDEAITHEIGHLLGLDHSQINIEVLTQYVFPCNVDDLAGLPLMFPEELCQARKTAGLPALSPDDLAWISSLYPNAQTANSYGMISGTIFFSDKVSQVQGANVIARLVDDPTTPEDESRRVAVSSISGYLFTGNPGQSFTAGVPGSSDNSNGESNGSRNPQLIGRYQIPLPPGTYTIEVESVYSNFISHSGIGPLSPPVPIPGPAEFWNQNETAFDFPLQRDTITIHAGESITGTDIILNNTQSTFDKFEDNSALIDGPLTAPFDAIAMGVRA
jgi:hypothetical protein